MAACWWRTFFPSLGLFLLTAAFIVTKTGRDALFFQNKGLLDLPKAYLGIAILSAPAAGFMLRLIRSIGPRRARVAGLCLMAALQCGFYFVVEPGGGWWMTLFFILVPLLYGVLLSITWLLSADLLDRVPRFLLARLYATIGASSMLGGLAGAALSRRWSAWLAPESFLLAGAVLLVATAAVNVIAARLFQVNVEEESEGMMPAPAEVPRTRDVFALLRIRYLALLAAIGMTGAVVGVLIEFQFYSAAAAAATSPRESLRLFADFYMLLNAAAVMVQLFATPFLQRVFGVYGSLLILPVALFGASAMVAWSATTGPRTVLRIAEGGIKSSVHRSNWEQSYLPVIRQQRAAAKLLVDGMAARMGEGTAAVLLLIAVPVLAGRDSGDSMPLNWLDAILVTGAAVWLGLTIALGRSRNAPELLPGSDDRRADLPIPDG
jgi:AAA family ATP:ADP antiporter